MDLLASLKRQRKQEVTSIFFVNNRFIKSAYLNHAVMNAFSDMIAKDSFPMYTLFIDLDPSRLDINVHLPSRK